MKEHVVQREDRIRNYWKEENTFNKSVQFREGKTPFVFYEGPPTANGLPHVGHALGRTIKDVVARYKTMKGFQVERKAGWDTHGLPVELGVEKQLGISGKQEIEKYGVEPFINKCKESVFTYEKIWRSFTEELGYWVDMDNPYLTLSNDYIESVWNILSKVHQDGLLYKGHRVSPYCPSCQTTLSSHEVAQGYKEVKDLSATVKFKRLDAENEYFLGWTTTPWTLPANVALAINPAITYVRAQKNQDVYIVAKNLVHKVFGEEVKLLSEHAGVELEGLRYTSPFSYVKVEKGHCVVLADYVTEDSGTGIVHIAPAYGEDDYKTVQQNNLSFMNVVNAQGCYSEEVADLKGRFVKDCDVDIIKMLSEQGTLFHKEKYEHSYPHCWRCDSPLLYYATESWFIKMTAVKEQMLSNNATVTWYPDHIKEGRFGNFLENLIDWNISRNRYWGTPLNVWICSSCNHEEVPGSIEALQRFTTSSISNIDLHKPYIDEVHCTCPKCNGVMQRTPEVIDVWFDSGSMPFAQHHYPFGNLEKFESHFPADVVIEGIDQTRGFFYSLLAVSTLFTGKAPYKNVLSLGHVLDENGQKMSKSKGNAFDPVDLIKEYGADALRFAFLVDSSPWNPKRFSKRIVQDAKSKLIDTLDNTYKFYEMYATIDGYVYNSQHKGKRTLLDEWILSRLHSTVKQVNDYMDHYQFTQASRELADLVDELSNWYVRRSRNRFWASGLTKEKVGAYSTLHETLTTLSRLLAPFVPFVSEDNHLKLNQNSVHLQDYPEANDLMIQQDLETDMKTVLKIVELGRSIRNTKNLKVKQPLQQLIVWHNENHSHLNNYSYIIKDELNVKEVIFTNDLSHYQTINFKLNFKTAGSAFGKQVNPVKEYVEHLEDTAKKLLLETGHLQIRIDGQSLTLEKNHILVEYQVAPGFELTGDEQLKVVLDLTLTDELLAEGQVRELIRAIQDARKKLDLPIEQYIYVEISASVETRKKILHFESLIKENVLVHNISFEEAASHEQVEVKFGNEVIKVSLKY